MRVPTAGNPSSAKTFVAMRTSPWKIVTVPMSFPSYTSSGKTCFLIEWTISLRPFNRSPAYNTPNIRPRESRMGTAAATTIPSDRYRSEVGRAATVSFNSIRARSARSFPSLASPSDESRMVPLAGWGLPSAADWSTAATTGFPERSSPLRSGFHARQVAFPLVSRTETKSTAPARCTSRRSGLSSP